MYIELSVRLLTIVGVRLCVMLLSRTPNATLLKKSRLHKKKVNMEKNTLVAAGVRNQCARRVPLSMRV